jgi:hypothetical protein
MALPDISGLVGIVPTMLKDLPQILLGAQIVFYIVLILAFGSIIAKGYRGYMHFALRLLLRLGLGFVALVCGLALSGLIPMFTNDIFYSMVQSMFVNPTLGIIISTAVLTVSLYLMSHNIFNVPGMKKQIDKLQEKLKRAEEVAAKSGKKMLEPVRIAGIVILAVFLVFSFLNFQGFPSLGEDVFSFLGISPEDIEELSSYAQGFSAGGEIPEGCVPVLTLMENNYDDFINDRLAESEDPGIKSMIEIGSGLTVTKVYMVTHEQMGFFVAIAGSSICSATQSRFCECLDMGSILP